MLSAKVFLGELKGRGFGLFSGVPCSLMSPLMQRVQASPEWRYVAAANEGDAVSVAAGAQLGGMKAAALMQNSGLGNAVNPLTSLCACYKIPVLLLISLRGDPEAEPDAPQHRLMGKITTDLLDLMEIKWRYLPGDPVEIPALLEEANLHMTATGKPFALIIRKKTFQDGCEVPEPPPRQLFPAPSGPMQPGLHPRPEFLKALVETTGPDSILIATTGYTGRELSDCADRDNHFYMAGSMGCASSIGLGLALTHPEKRILVLDGDAALTMRMGTLAAIAQQAPQNLIHIVFDNAMNESTGGQPAPGAGVDFAWVAQACGYARTARLARPKELLESLDGPGPALLHVPVLPGSQGASPRPELPPHELAQRLRSLLK